MKINKQLFEDVLSGKLKGRFVFRNQLTCNSDELTRNTTDKYKFTHPYIIGNRSYTPSGIYYLDGESNVDIVDFIPNMKTNELTIEIPEGKIVDWDESKKQNKIVLKNKQLTYEEICKKLFEDGAYYTNAIGKIWPDTLGRKSTLECKSDSDSNNATTKHQLECILAKNKLANVAVYLNNGWKPYKGDHVFTIRHYGDSKDKLIISEHYFRTGENLVLFQTQKNAKQAIEILGEETVKLALEPLGI